MAKTRDTRPPSPPHTRDAAPIDWIGVGERLDVARAIFAIVTAVVATAVTIGFVLLAQLYTPLDHGIGSVIVVIAAILIAVTILWTAATAFYGARSRARDRLMKSMAASEPELFAHIKQEMDRSFKAETGTNESEAR